MRKPRDMSVAEVEAFFVHAGPRAQGVRLHSQSGTQCATVLVPRSGVERHHHLFEERLQRDLKMSVATADIVKPVSVHTLRHLFATHLLHSDTDIRTVQELLGHSDVSTTMIHTHVLKVAADSTAGPLDALLEA